MGENPHAADDAPRVPASSADAIDAEIADHLASAVAQFQAQGAPPAAAERTAHDRFGDVTAIRRRCYWIHEGESLMFRTAVLVLLVGLSLGLTVAAVGTWRSQSRLTEQVTALTEQLKLLAENQRAAVPPAPAEPKPLEIVGRVYAGSPEQPVAGKELVIVSVKDGNIIRRVLSDAQGNYRSGPLADGDYSLVAALESNTPPFHPYAQSQPIYVYPGVGATKFDFDVAYHAGRLRLTTSRPLPRREVAGKYTIDSRLMVMVEIPRMRGSLWTSNLTVPDRWPLFTRNLYVGSGSLGWSRRSSSQSPYTIEFLELLSPSDLDADWSQTRFADAVGLMPAGEVTVLAGLLVDVVPMGDRPTIAMPNPNRGGGPGGPWSFDPADNRKLRQKWLTVPNRMAPAVGGLLHPRALEKPTLTTEDDDFFWFTKGLGKRWLEHLQRKPDEEVLPAPFLVWSWWVDIGAEAAPVPVTDGQTTRVRVEIPDDVEDKLQQFVESATDPAAFSQRTLGEDVNTVGNRGDQRQQTSAEIQSGTSPFFRKVTLTVEGTDKGTE